MGTVDGGKNRTCRSRDSGRVAVKVDAHGGGPSGVLDIVAIVGRFLVLGDGFGRLVELAEVQRDFLGREFLVVTTIQDNVDDGIDISDIDLAIAVDVAVTVIATVQDDVDDSVDVSDVHLTVAVNVAPGSTGSEGHCDD